MTSTSLFLPATLTRSATIALPGSKSISNRALLLAALSQGQCRLHNLLHSDDTARMLEALAALGVRYHTENHNLIVVQGCGGAFRRQAKLFLGNAGTAFRPLTAVLAVLGGAYELSGVARMHERPIGDLVDALRQAGATIDYAQNSGYPPLVIGEFTPQANDIAIRGDVSSQFLSALLMALPLTAQAHSVRVIGELISQPYIDLTIHLMRDFGVAVGLDRHHWIFRLPEKASYRAPQDFFIEGDASGASYFFAAGLLGQAPITVTGLHPNSIQGDVALLQHLATLGAQVRWQDYAVTVSPAPQPLPAFDIDATAIPDAAMVLPIIALTAAGTSTLRGIGSWRVKETDRINAMATELRKLGATVTTTADSLSITPPPQLRTDIAIDTYDDHRMAMCFSLISLLGVNVIINDPSCVAKTYPQYFDHFARLTELSA